MEIVNPYNRQDPEQWKRHNVEVMQNIHDDALKAIIDCVLNLHELEKTGDWKRPTGVLTTQIQHLKYIFSIIRHGLSKISGCWRRPFSSTSMS